MDEYIKKSEAADVIVKYPYDISGKTATAIKMIEDLPSADVVEVVRCKDCKRIETTEYGGYCRLKKIGVAYNDFCSYGKRRE